MLINNNTSIILSEYSCGNFGGSIYLPEKFLLPDQKECMEFHRYVEFCYIQLEKILDEVREKKENFVIE